MSAAAPVRTYLVEPQKLFVAELVDTLSAANLNVLQVSPTIEPSDLLRKQPKVLFVDIDYIGDEPLAAISIVRTLLPEALICVYTEKHSANWSKECRQAGADGIISKAATSSEVQAGVRDLLTSGTFTDKRLPEEE